MNSMVFLLVSVASASKSDDVAGSDVDRSSAETLSIIGTGAGTQQSNCALCAGAITQEVSVMMLEIRLYWILAPAPACNLMWTGNHECPE